MLTKVVIILTLVTDLDFVVEPPLSLNMHNNTFWVLGLAFITKY
jgi:hypothetical protein